MSKVMKWRCSHECLNFSFLSIWSDCADWICDYFYGQGAKMEKRYLYLTLIKLFLSIYFMYRKTCNTSGKIIGIFLFSLIVSLPVPAYASYKSLVLFPLAIYADQSKAYIGQGIKRMLISRISGAGIEIVPDEKYASLLSEKEDAGITSQKRAEELARVLKADYAIFGSITTIGGDPN